MKRLLRNLGLFFLLGAIVNIAVAWGIAWSIEFEIPKSHPPPTEAYHFSHNVNWYVINNRAFGSARVVSICPENLSGDIEYMDANAPVLPHWAGAQDQLADAGAGRRFFKKAEARGWPALSLCALFHRDDPTENFEPPRGGIELAAPLPQPANIFLDNNRTLPLIPIWPGFAVNTVLYGTILWLLSAATIAVRHCSRKRRGLCPACSYPVGVSLVCTECGKPVHIEPVP